MSVMRMNKIILGKEFAAVHSGIVATAVIRAAPLPLWLISVPPCGDGNVCEPSSVVGPSRNKAVTAPMNPEPPPPPAYPPPPQPK
jgi:hypothetical protein